VQEGVGVPETSEERGALLVMLVSPILMAHYRKPPLD
jgi:hypothetical protein